VIDDVITRAATPWWRHLTQALGVEVRFGCSVKDLIVEGGSTTGVILEGETAVRGYWLIGCAAASCGTSVCLLQCATQFLQFVKGAKGISQWLTWSSRVP
jgi:hypothetical protein